MGACLAIFRIIVTVETGQSLCPVYVNAVSQSAALDLARSQGLLMNGEKASVERIERNPIPLNFGSIAIG
jgi:hypothetical protein